MSEGGMVEAQEISAETAFIIVKELDGTFRATTDLTSAFTVARDADRLDIKSGCHEIHQVIAQEELAERIAVKLQKDTPQTQALIRKALEDRDIL